MFLCPQVTPYYYLSDHLGSDTVVASGDGKTIQWEADYFPFGALRTVITREIRWGLAAGVNAVAGLAVAATGLGAPLGAVLGGIAAVEGLGAAALFF